MGDEHRWGAWLLAVLALGVGACGFGTPEAAPVDSGGTDTAAETDTAGTDTDSATDTDSGTATTTTTERTTTTTTERSTTTTTEPATTTEAPTTEPPPTGGSGEIRLACSTLGGTGRRDSPLEIPYQPGSRLVLEGCRGFPLGQGQPDHYLLTVPDPVPPAAQVLIDYQLTADQDAENTFTVDDLGPQRLAVQPVRYRDGDYAQRYLQLSDAGIGPGQWYVVVERLRAVSSSPPFNMVIDYR